MDTTFPFGFPAPTAFYLVMYVLTFALHQAFMHYVLAGSVYVAWATIFPGKGDVPRARMPLASVLRDWMPFMLSAAITAGVAPLLFVQIVYPVHFYTANLLLGWRWMVVIPVLIVGFYLLYVVKSRALSNWNAVTRSAVVIVVAICFLFVGFCWTANHLLAADESNWPEIYRSGKTMLSVHLVAMRMVVWAGGAFASMAVIAAWQIRGQLSNSEKEEVYPENATLAWCGLAGVVVAVISAFAYVASSDQLGFVFGTLALPYACLAALGAIIQVAGWILWLRGRSSLTMLLTVSAGWLLSLLGVSAVRETLRLRVIDIEALAERHQQAAEVGGFGVFLVFAVINTLLIGTCVWLVRRRLNSTSD